MFPSFTGSTRPRRQVNLSGRTNNPFAALPGSKTSSSPQSAQNALANAQQERFLRQQERLRPPAATRLQKVWRGHKERKETREQWRQEWDREERWSPPGSPTEQTQDSSQTMPAPAPYDSESDCLSSLRLLIQFASPHNQGDVHRLYHYARRYLQSGPLQPSSLPDRWTYPLLRLAKLTLDTLGTEFPSLLPSYTVDGLLNLLRSLAATIPKQLAPYSQRFFKTLATVAVTHRSRNLELLSATTLSLLQPVTSEVDAVYEGFVGELFTTPELPILFGSLKKFAGHINYEYLTVAISRYLFPSNDADMTQSNSREGLLWFLAYFIYFRRQILSERARTRNLPDVSYIKIVSKLISFLADDIGNRMDVSTIGSSISDDRPTPAIISPEPLPAFVRSEISTLISQENISSLLANIDVVATPQNPAPRSSNDASALASYALTLLRAFPRRGDEIRMWLYRGSTSRQAQTAQGSKALPAIKYFYQATSRTRIFESISREPRETVDMLRPDKDRNLSIKSSSQMTDKSRDQQWRVILLFLELYTFVLKVMDDEEFLSGTLESKQEWSWTRQSALPLEQVKDLTVFLKNLAFSMYWNASEIAGIEATEAKTSLAEYFGGTRPAQAEKSQTEAPATFADMSVAGVSGMTLAYMKGMVTGVLRMVYERE